MAQPVTAVASAIQTSVIVVGGGPVGLGLAVTLGKAGIPCVVLESRKAAVIRAAGRFGGKAVTDLEP